MAKLHKVMMVNTIVPQQVSLKVNLYYGPSWRSEGAVGELYEFEIDVIISPRNRHIDVLSIVPIPHISEINRQTNGISRALKEGIKYSLNLHDAQVRIPSDVLVP